MNTLTSQKFKLTLAAAALAAAVSPATRAWVVPSRYGVFRV